MERPLVFHHQKGETLVEVIVCILLVAFIGIVAGYYTVYTKKLSIRTKQFAWASETASSALEEAKSKLKSNSFETAIQNKMRSNRDTIISLDYTKVHNVNFYPKLYFEPLSSDVSLMRIVAEVTWNDDRIFQMRTIHPFQ